jgi:C_GCAxxG_C_C family probable redox protein
MIYRGGNKFNCCESVLIRVDDRHPLPGFGPEALKIASGFGGGVAGWGSVCGAASGGVMALALLNGTDGGESPEVFQERRDELRSVSQDFLKSFEREFGSMNCVDLLGVDRRTEEGKRRYDELKAQGVFRCSEYVDWAAERVLKMLGD